jgi:hypothetical protein
MSSRDASTLRFVAACLVGPLLAGLFYASTLDGTYLEDDIFTAALVDAGQAEPHTDWSRVLAEFGRPWGTDRGMFYRPLVTLSAAVDYTIAGPSARMNHLTNILLHVFASFFCALVCAAVCPKRRTAAALLGGMIFALHPAATEPVCWLAARTSSLAIMFQLIALTAFARYRLRESGVSLAVCALACGAAYLSKEEAVVTPAVLFALDVILCVVHGGRPRLRAHLVLLPVWGGYWLLRYIALDEYWLGGGQPALDVQIAMLHLLQKLGVVLMPVMQLQWPGQVAVLLACAAVVIGTCLSDRRGRWIFPICLVWCVASVAPSLPFSQSPNLAGSRYVYGAIAALAVASVSALDSRFTIIRRGLPVVLVVWCALFAGVTWQRVGDYRVAFQDTRNLYASLVDVTRDTTAARPLAVMSTPPGRNGIPGIRASSLFALAERPLSPVDIPVLSIWFSFYRTPRSIALWNDAGPLRAMQRMGAGIVGWSNAEAVFEPLARDGGPLVPLKLSTEDGRRFGFGGSVSPERIESLRVEVQGRPSGGTLYWFARPRDGSGGQEVVSEAIPFRGPWTDQGRSVFTIDLYNDWDFLLASYAGRVRGFLVDLDGEGVSVESVTTTPRLEPLTLPTVFADQTLTIREESARFSAPELPRPGCRMNLVLMGPDRGYTMKVEPGQPITFPDEIRLPLERSLHFSRQSRYYYYFQTRSPSARSLPGARSEVDWFRLLPPTEP